MSKFSWYKKFKEKKIAEALAIYLGSAWVLREGLKFIVEKYNWTIWISDSLTILVIFGLPALLIYLWYNENLTKKALLYQSINLIIALSLIGFDLFNPGELKTISSQIIHSKKSKKNIAKSINSLVVLPFENYTGDDSLEYFVSGMHNALSGDIGKISALRVPSATTSKVYKNNEKSIPQITTELGVDAALEASVMCLGDSICLKIKLVSAYPNEQQIWVKDYYEEKSKILSLYNEITKQISDDLNIVLTPQEINNLNKSSLVVPEAYDAYLKGLYYWEKLDEVSIKKALKYFQIAAELDPEWADPQAGLANAWGLFSFFQYLPPSVTLPKVYPYLNKALELNPNSAQAHYVAGILAVWTEWDWEKGEREFLKSIELDPNNALCRMYYAHLLMILRRTDEANQQAKIGLELDSLKPLVLGLNGIILWLNNNDLQGAIETLQKSISIDPNFGFGIYNLKTITMENAYENGDYEKWIDLWHDKVLLGGRWNHEGIQAVLNTFKEQGHIAAIKEMFNMNSKYENYCYMSEGVKMERLLKLGEYEKVIAMLEKDLEKRDPSMPYISTKYHYYNIFKKYPQYIEILRKMNLPIK